MMNLIREARGGSTPQNAFLNWLSALKKQSLHVQLNLIMRSPRRPYPDLEAIEAPCGCQHRYLRSSPFARSASPDRP